MQRTVLTTTALFCGLWLIILAEHPVEVWKSGVPHANSPRRRWLALAMLGAYGVVYAFPPLRDHVEAVVVQILWRYDVFARVLIPKE